MNSYHEVITWVCGIVAMILISVSALKLKIKKDAEEAWSRPWKIWGAWKDATLWPRIYFMYEKCLCRARPEWRLQKIITWLQKERSEGEKQKLIATFKGVQDKFPKVMFATDINVWGPVYWYALACAAILEGKEINLEWPADKDAIDYEKANFLPPPKEKHEALALLAYFLHFDRFSYN